MEQLMKYVGNLDFSPLWVSLKIGVTATAVCFLLGLYAARTVVRARPWVKAVMDGLLTLPMVVPPTAAGFFLLLVFSPQRPLGGWLFDSYHVKVVQSFLGCVTAAVVIALPLMYRNARAAFEQVDVNLIYAGQTLGMSDLRIFWQVVIPEAGPGVAAGTILTFARALGEYGATSMLAGNIAGRTGTIAQRIAMVIQDGDFLTAGIWVAIVMGIGLVIVVLLNLALRKNRNQIIRW